MPLRHVIRNRATLKDRAIVAWTLVVSGRRLIRAGRAGRGAHRSPGAPSIGEASMTVEESYDRYAQDLAQRLQQIAPHLHAQVWRHADVAQAGKVLGLDAE